MMFGDYNPIVEGVMSSVLREMCRVDSNINRHQWNMREPIQIGDVRAEVQAFESRDAMLHIIYNDVRVSAWLDGKRAFYRSYLSDGQDVHSFVDWAAQLLDHLSRFDSEHIDRMRQLWRSAAKAGGSL